MGSAIIVALAISAVVVLYWLLITTEGTYLGARAVALLYDWTARRYDAIKNVHFVDEALFIGVPLQQALIDLPAPRVLDVATGTGRVASTLFSRWGFGGLVVGMDRSVRMLTQALKVTQAHAQQVHYVAGDAQSLCWDDGSFDCLTCLEAIEFVPDGAQAIAEMWRVLKPGGTLLVSNRVGPEARLFPGRIARRGRLEQHLEQAGFTHVRSQRWQVHYDLIWAQKPGGHGGPGPESLWQERNV